MILFFVCVCVVLALACAGLAILLDRTRRNAGNEIAALDKDLAKVRAECDVLSDACDLYIKEQAADRKALGKAESRKAEALATVDEQTRVIAAKNKEIAELQQANVTLLAIKEELGRQNDGLRKKADDLKRTAREIHSKAGHMIV